MKQFVGTVVSTIDQTSAVVLVESSWKHPLYKKTVRRSKKFLVQNDVAAKAGEVVTIQETRPLSARKRFMITEVLKK